jgi:DNA-binding NarL/FixJ family response regulator
MWGTMKLVLCDDNLILAEALVPALTARGHEVMAIATSLAGCIAEVTAHQPDACLLGLRFPDGEDSLAAACTIGADNPDTALVILAAAPNPSIAYRARKLGVAAFLGKDQDVAQIADALDVVASGGALFAPTLSSSERSVVPQRSEPQYELTPRESEVLRRIVAGQGTMQMAREMNIAPSTLRTYVKNLLTKLGAHSRLQAAALASREGLVAELSA